LDGLGGSDGDGDGDGDPRGLIERDPNGRRGDRPLVLPEILEPVPRQLGVPDRVCNVAMTKIRLQGAGVMAGVREGEAAGVPDRAPEPAKDGGRRARA
jgi:hypothetical protein